MGLVFVFETISAELTADSPVLAWDRVDAQGSRLSDHPTIAIDVRMNLVD